MKKISGVSLVSLIIGVALSSVVFMSMGGIFSSSKANQTVSEAMNELNELSRSIQKNVYDLVTQAGTMVPNGGTGLNPTYVSAFVESNYSSAPGGGAPSNGLVLGYFNYNSVNTNLWIKTYGNAAGLIRSCVGIETATAQDFRIILFTQTTGGQTGFYCAKQVWGQTAAAAMANATTLIPPANLDSLYMKFGISSLYLGCYGDTATRALNGGCLTTTGSISASDTGCTNAASVAGCEKAAIQNSYVFFGVQACSGVPTTCQCLVGNSYTSAIQYGTSGGCPSPQLGGNWANSLYLVNGTLSKWVDPQNLGTFTDYSTSTAITTLNVQYVRYTFLIKSTNPVLPSAITQTFQVMDNSVGSQISRISANMYKLIVLTVPLVNNPVRSSTS